MSYVKGDRVRMVNNPAQVGTVTGERDQMFLSFVGVAWDGLGFAFVPPSNIELDTPVATPGLNGVERYYDLMAAAARNGSPNATIDAGQNRTESGTDVVESDFLGDVATGIRKAHEVACYNDGHDFNAWTAAAYYVIKRFRLDQ